MRLVRSFLPLVLVGGLSIGASSMEGGESASASAARIPGAHEVSFNQEVIYHPRHEKLHLLCQAPIEVLGCTEFPAERFECSCERDGAQWVLHPRAAITAAVHLSRRGAYDRVLLHERLHIVDLEAALRAHFDTIVEQRFDQQSTCELLARVISSPSYARDVMNRLRKASNEKHRCQRPGKTPSVELDPAEVAAARKRASRLRQKAGMSD